MPEININTPALLFPAISLLMLAYTNRFFAIAARVRSLHDEYAKAPNKEIVFRQIKNLRKRLNMIRNMQVLGVVCFLLSMICMYCIFRGAMAAANIIFAVSLISLIASLVISLMEIFISTHAVELELSDMEGLEKNGLMDMFKRE
jgi:amino acid transporter